MPFRTISVLLEANDQQLSSTVRRASATMDQFGRRTGVSARSVASLADSTARLQAATLRQTAAQERYNRLLASGETDTVKLARAQAAVVSADRAVAAAQEKVAVATRASNVVQAEAVGVGSKLEGIVGRGLTRSMTGFVAATVGGYAAGRALNTALRSVVGGAVQFEAQMRNVNSISGLSAQQLSTLSNQVIDLSRQVPQSANDLAGGLYNIASSGFQGADGLKVLTASARAATAGITDTATSAQAIVGVLNAYGKGANDAQRVSDSLFQTVNVGVLSFGDLAQGIGQVVGTASAAGVGIDQLGGAIATMTRAGIVPAEAFTSLNQVLAQIIQPGAAMTRLFHQLGYESGAAALSSKGLAGVMEDIRRATGGNVTEMANLFTDTRSLRGALALATNGGKLYAESLRSMQEAHQGVGATERTFDEQMKSTAAQWQLLKNRTEAAAISLGTKLLPTMRDGIHAVEVLGQVLSNEGVRHALEFAAALYAVNKAIKLGRAAWGSEIITLLRNTAAGHTANAAAIAEEGAAAAAAAPKIAELDLAEQGGGFRSRLGTVGMGAALGTLATRATVAATALYFVGQAQDSLARKFYPGPDVGRLNASLQDLAVTGKAMGEMTKTFGANLDDLAGKLHRITDPGIVNRFNDVMGSIFHVGGHLGSAHPDLDQAHKDFDAVDQSLTDMVNSGNLQAAQRVFGILADKVKAQGGSVDDLLSVLPNYKTALQTATHGNVDAATAAGKTTGQLDKQAIAAANAAAQQQKLAVAFGKTVRQSFLGAFDVSSEFQPGQAAQEVAAATAQLTDAQRALSQVQAEEKPQASTLADARQRVADATENLAKAQADAAKTGNLANIYRQNVRDARSFVDEVNQVIERGLDPSEVARLLREGPRQADAELSALVADHSNHLIQLANASARALSRISTAAVRQAQFTARAVNAPLDSAERMARELPHALALDTLLRNMPSGADGKFLENKLGLSAKQVRQIAQDFGITLSTYIQNTLDHHPVHVTVTGAPVHGAHRIGGFAGGGQISGPGTGTSDSIVARVSNGEWIVRKAAVDFYGSRHLAALNAMALPRFAVGGSVGPQRAAPTVVMVRGSDGAAAVQPLHKTEINVGELHARDYEQFLQQVETHRRMVGVTP